MKKKLKIFKKNIDNVTQMMYNMITVRKGSSKNENSRNKKK